MLFFNLFFWFILGQFRLGRLTTGRIQLFLFYLLEGIWFPVIGWVWLSYDLFFGVYYYIMIYSVNLYVICLFYWKKVLLKYLILRIFPSPPIIKDGLQTTLIADCRFILFVLIPYGADFNTVYFHAMYGWFILNKATCV